MGNISRRNGVAVLVDFHDQRVGQQQRGACRIRANGAGADEHHVVASLAGDLAAVDSGQRPSLGATREDNASTHQEPYEKSALNF